MVGGNEMKTNPAPPPSLEDEARAYMAEVQKHVLQIDGLGFEGMLIGFGTQQYDAGREAARREAKAEIVADLEQFAIGRPWLRVYIDSLRGESDSPDDSQAAATMRVTEFLGIDPYTDQVKCGQCEKWMATVDGTWDEGEEMIKCPACSAASSVCVCGHRRDLHVKPPHLRPRYCSIWTCYCQSYRPKEQE
jgi:hypothetical protein